MLYTTITIKDKEYRARLNAKASVDLEKRLGTNPLNILMKISDGAAIPDLTSLITILHASFQAYEHGITLDKTYEIYDDFVDEGNTLMELIPIILEVFKVSGFFRDNKEEDEKN